MGNIADSLVYRALVASGGRSGGGGESGGSVVSVPAKDVNFYDYDGVRLYSYTLEEASALTAMPDAPKHDGLTFQRWNYTLEKVQSATRPMDVGATYISADGKTRLYINVPANAMAGSSPPRNQVPLYISQTVENGVTIDWGDGSDPETLPGTGIVNTSHIYQTGGDFVITLDHSDGCTLGLGHGVSSVCVMGSTANSNTVYRTMLKRVVIGDGVTGIDSCAFMQCSGLVHVVIPDSVTSIGMSAFNKCYSLTCVVIPDGVARIENNTFLDCYSLTRVVMPYSVDYAGSDVFSGCSSLASVVISDSVTRIGFDDFRGCAVLTSVVIPDMVTVIDYTAFRDCGSLVSVVISDSVKTINYSVFANCYGMKEYHFLPTTPPVLGTNVFSGMPSDCIIYVPHGCLEAYQTATNWATYADHIQEEPT